MPFQPDAPYSLSPESHPSHEPATEPATAATVLSALNLLRARALELRESSPLGAGDRTRGNRAGRDNREPCEFFH